MTTYITIRSRKRNFVVPVTLPEREDTATVYALADDIRRARNGDLRITRELDIRFSHNTATGYPLKIGARKRSFTIQGKVRNG